MLITVSACVCIFGASGSFYIIVCFMHTALHTFPFNFQKEALRLSLSLYHSIARPCYAVLLMFDLAPISSTIKTFSVSISCSNLDHQNFSVPFHCHHPSHSLSLISLFNLSPCHDYMYVLYPWHCRYVTNKTIFLSFSMARWFSHSPHIYKYRDGYAAHYFYHFHVISFMLFFQ